MGTRDGNARPPRGEDCCEEIAVDSQQKALLRNAHRQEIVEQLDCTPGVNKNILTASLDIARSSLDFHVDRLRRADIVVTKKGLKGRQRICFLQRDEHLWENPKTQILFGGDPARNVALYIADNPGATLEDLSNALERSKSTVRHHLKALREHGLVDTIRIDRTHEHHPRPSLLEWTCEVGDGFQRPWEGPDDEGPEGS